MQISPYKKVVPGQEDKAKIRDKPIKDIGKSIPEDKMAADRPGKFGPAMEAYKHPVGADKVPLAKEIDKIEKSLPKEEVESTATITFCTLYIL